MRQERPPLARIDTIDVTWLPLQRHHGFTIRQSIGTGVGTTRLVPDAATCRSCLDELFDPASRFHLYPFVTCTHCGPRFTITRRPPYDRANTSMAAFSLCQDCAADYGNPANRRFHAETIACAACGPHLSHSMAEIATALGQGQIVDAKGHRRLPSLMRRDQRGCGQALRLRKLRPAKPFAIMVANAASAAHFAGPTPAELVLLRDAARPIVLVRLRDGLAASIAPRLDRVGVMLPSAPVHHLLFHALAGYPDGKSWLAEPLPIALVATSANAAGEPLVITDCGRAPRFGGHRRHDRHP